MRMEVKETVYKDAKTLSIHCKVSDRFKASILDEQGNEIFAQEDGYVWDIMPGDHFGDYIMLDIDLETGVVKNWLKPSEGQLAKIAEEE